MTWKDEKIRINWTLKKTQIYSSLSIWSWKISQNKLIFLCRCCCALLVVYSHLWWADIVSMMRSLRVVFLHESYGIGDLSYANIQRCVTSRNFLNWNKMSFFDTKVINMRYCGPTWNCIYFIIRSFSRVLHNGAQVTVAVDTVDTSVYRGGISAIVEEGNVSLEIFADLPTTSFLPVSTASCPLNCSKWNICHSKHMVRVL